MDLDGHTGTPGPATNSPTPLPSLASAQDTIVFPRSIPAPGPLGFLPAEIRIPLYEQILYDNTGANAMHKQNTHIDASYIPTLAKLEDHHGFIISCKTIKSEFEYE
ncbi:hypothetical protein BKA66DRAFT_571777 [Pyrenochaeta sp. MPI-SDFR-AT-0127]|nr:hypothetical protein BKA66DRAFT_571777 [Pyrenochaeta sp. MPI-SDFR-AT-0127]